MLELDSDVQIDHTRYNFLYTAIVLSLWYMILQIGDFYFYATLPEQYRPIKGFDIPISLWLLCNGIFGIQTALFFVVYQWYRMVMNVNPHLLFTVFLFLAFGISWTISGWICVYQIQMNIQKHNDLFENYLFFKVSVQSVFFILGYCVFYPCEN